MGNVLVTKKSNYYEQFFNEIKNETGENRAIVVSTVLCAAMGNDLAGGVFLSQLIYWSDKGKRLDGYVWKSASEWKKETFLSNYQIVKIRKKLLKLGLIEAKLQKAQGTPTVHYKLNRDNLEKWILNFIKNQSKNFKNGNSKNSTSITETTTEIYTDSTTTVQSGSYGSNVDIQTDVVVLGEENDERSRVDLNKSYGIHEIRSELETMGVTVHSATIADWVKRYDASQVWKQVKNLKMELKKKKIAGKRIASPGGWINSALAKNYEVVDISTKNRVKTEEELEKAAQQERALINMLD